MTVLLTTALSAGAHVADPGPRRSGPGVGTHPARGLTIASPPGPIGTPRTPPRPNLVTRKAKAPPPEPVKPARSPAPKVKPSERKPKQVLRGAASWYGHDFAGNSTASGEVYEPSELTAAHRSLPFGTRIRVTNQLNRRSVVVRVNDRGPFAGNRILDVSSAAADRLGMKGHGVVPVIVQVL